MTLIKSISGIRGIINTSIDSDLVAKYVKAFCNISANSTILLARDTRNSGDKFIKESIYTLKNLNKEYINCGIIPTPTAQYLIKKNNYAGGIVFTASHNPENWNGMKFIDSNGIFLDYQKFNDLENEAEKTIVNNWLHSGDLGYMDNDGYLFLVDRVKDMIISGGVNVFPKDIEEVIIKHPDVAEVAVFGAPDKRWGETPVAAVICHSDYCVSAATLKLWTNQRVHAKFQKVKEILILDSFPRNVAGKTLKREMRETYLNR